MNQHMSAIHAMISGNINTMNLAADVYDLIAAAPEDEGPKLFRQACLEFKYTPTDRLNAPCPELCAPAQLECYRQAITLLDELYAALTGMGFEEEDFNRHLWHAISSESICKDLALRRALMFCCARDPRIPYLDPDRQPEESKTEDLPAPLLYSSIAHILHYPGFTSPRQQADRIAPYLRQVTDAEQMNAIVTLLLHGSEEDILSERLSKLDNLDLKDFDPDSFDPDALDPEVFDPWEIDPERPIGPKAEQADPIMERRTYREL